MTMTRLRFLMGLLSGHWSWGLLGLLCALACAAANMILLAVSGWFITGMAVAGVTATAFNYFVPSAIIRACAIVRSGGRYLERLFTHDAALRVVATLRPRLFRAFARKPRLALALTEGAENGHSAALAGRLGADLDTLQRFYLQILTPGVVAALLGLTAVVFTACSSMSAAGALLGLLLLGGAVLPWALARMGARLGFETMALRTRLRVALADGVGGREELIAFGALERHEARIEDLNARLARTRAKVAFQDALGSAILPGLAGAALWAMTLTLAPDVLAGEMSGTRLATLVFLGFVSFELLTPLPEAFQRLGATNAVLDRVVDMPLSPAEAGQEPEAPGSGPAPPCPSRGVAITLENVTVAPITAGDRPPLNALSLRLAPGRKIGLVGPSGAGKSTAALIVAGAAAWSAGRVIVGDRTATDPNDAVFRGLVSLAPQTPAFLSDSVRRNLLIARPDAPDDALTEALSAVHLTEWLAGLPNGLDTLIGEGGRGLSGGEARRLSIARALLGTGPVLILDEPGEGLDPRLEADVLRSVTEAAGDRPMLLITHRPQGLELMDEIAVMEAGQVVQHGSPWALATADGPFRTFLERAAI